MPRKKAADTETAVVEATKAEKAVEEKAKEETVKKPAARKTAAKKTEEVVEKAAPKKEPVKKAAVKKTAPKNAEPEATVTIQYQGKEIVTVEILEAAKAAFAKANPEVEIKTIDLYVKPEEGAAYYAVNGQGSEDYKIEL